MPKRSRRIAKRNEFENSLKVVEEALGAMRSRNPAGFARGRESAPTEQGGAEETGGSSRREMVEEAAAKRRSGKKA
jgi:hypothetical protein